MITKGTFRIFTLFLCATAFSSAQDFARGTITGQVVNTDGKPVAGARVSVLRPGLPTASAIRYVPTDPEGNFVMTGFVFGTYHVFAKKEEEGYPDNYWNPFQNRVPPEVRLYPEAPTANVKVVIGPKAAVLSGTIRDSTTGRDLGGVGIRFWKTSDAGQWVSESAESPFRILIPPS